MIDLYSTTISKRIEGTVHLFGPILLFV